MSNRATEALVADLEAAIETTHFTGKAHLGAFRKGFLARRKKRDGVRFGLRCPYRDTSMQARGFMRAWQAGWGAG